ncbi:nitroreductase family protein [Lihuaxuella thermophila]|uniref:Nitroreductase n=1 Tax=Lihuaxuella thermophila TaxID=1173111 RepID=A0A1H8D3A1_9BACL|nr:nitroreductase family protein [Lihuaxuella thermophila]SEN01214.1 Nitroreductase [Lihuaxuella thermophila]
MTTKTQLSVEEAMKARHSVRKYQPGVVIPKEELNEILALAATAPSSWNLQHWRYLVITSREQKERILPIAYGQQQVVDSSATIVILGDLEADKSAAPVYQQSLDKGLITQEVYNIMISQIESAYKGNPELAHREAILNASLSAMQLMLAAKAKGYDTCPMGGFDREALIKELNIPPRFIPVMMITIGKAAAPAHATMRFPLEELVIEESF